MPLEPQFNDISEELQINLSTSAEASFSPTDTAFDISIGKNSFLAYNTPQSQHIRETAQYKKDQFDSSVEPGEQSLVGWWLRSQTSWHDGAGIKYFEPGVEKNVNHRFYDSRGVDIWNIGELRLHKKVAYAYTGNSGINAASGHDGTKEILVTGDNKGILKKITLNGNTTAATSNYVKTSTSYPDGHSGTDFPFYSVTTDGSTYYAACTRCIHQGTIGTAASDNIFFKHSASDNTKVLVKYAKGNVFIGMGKTFGLLNTNASASAKTHTTGAIDTFANSFIHINSSWNWVDATASPGPLFFAGNGGNNGEIWAATLSRNTTVASVAIALSEATMALSLPDGETINAIHYYLGYLAIGTNLGIRICPIGTNDLPVLGPLLFESQYSVNGFTERGTYLYAATKADNTSYTHGILVRIDLSQQFEDGTFAYAYDLEYASATSNADCTEVYSIEDRLVMVIQENGDVAGELQVEHTTDYVSTGWLQTGYIRYATTEPKFFKFLNLQGELGTSDTISLQTIDASGVVYDIMDVTTPSLNKDIELHYPVGNQEMIAFKFTLNNGVASTSNPVLKSYRLKSLPAVKRQRLIQYPLSCFDIEQDRFNSQYGYIGRAYDLIVAMEALEEAGDFVLVNDWRTNESYTGVIETMRFENTASSDKNSSGYGGILTVTIRKIK